MITDYLEETLFCSVCIKLNDGSILTIQISSLVSWYYNNSEDSDTPGGEN